jgi:hypothetical protein
MYQGCLPLPLKSSEPAGILDPCWQGWWLPVNQVPSSTAPSSLLEGGGPGRHDDIAAAPAKLKQKPYPGAIEEAQTYRDLEALTDGLTAQLNQHGVGNGDCAAIVWAAGDAAQANELSGLRLQAGEQGR